MPLVKINIQDGQIADAETALAALDAAADAQAYGTPAIVMVHGYKFSPRLPAHDPHDHILSLNPRRGCYKALSWPKALGAASRDDPRAPLCIALGWEARSTPHRAYATAAQTGAPLARLLERLRARRTDLRLGAIAHSMGARVVLSALSHTRPGTLSRAVLLAPAEMRKAADAFLDGPGGAQADILCVTSRENALFERMLGWSVAPHRVFDRPLGHRARIWHPRITHLRLDDPTAAAVLHAMGYRLSPERARVCHWSVYLRDGLFPLYRAVLDGRLPIPALRAALPMQAAPLRPLPALAPVPFGPARALPLPFGRKPSSS